MFSQSVVQFFATPWTVAPQARLSMEFSRQEYCRGLPCPTPQDLPNPGIECTSPSLTGRFFTTAPPGKLTLCSFNLNFLLFHLKMLCFLKITYFNKRGSPQMKIILLNCIGIVLHLESWILRLMPLPFTKEKDLSREELNIWGHQIEHFLWW